MISPRAQDSIDRIFQRAARSRLALASDDDCSIVPASEGMAGDAEVVVLTISSMTFRLLLLLHFREDAPTQAYFLRGGADRTLREAFVEIGNLCCGAINQELARHFPDVGMSTPYLLNARCVPHLGELKPDHAASYTITIAGTVRLDATLCVCANAPVDFVADTTVVVEDNCGELELF